MRSDRRVLSTSNHAYAMNTPRSRLWIALSFSVTCAACAGSDFQWDQARQIQPGMTEDQVSALMGPPTAMRTQSGGVTWTWAHVDPRVDSARAVSVGFREGRVVYGAGVPQSFK
jgi:hypothetical protein